MATFCGTTGVRNLTGTPHRKTLLACISNNEPSAPCSGSHHSIISSGYKPCLNRALSRSTSYHCWTRGLQHCYAHSTSVFRNRKGTPSLCLRRGESMQPQKPMDKVLHQVNLSNMARSSFNRFLGKHCRPVAPSTLHLQNEETSQLVRVHKREGSSKTQPDTELEGGVPKQIEDGQKILEVLPAPDNPSNQQPASEVVDTCPASKGEDHCEKHSLEKAVEETNQNISPKESTVNLTNMTRSSFTFKRFIDKLWALAPSTPHPQKEEPIVHKHEESSKEKPDMELEWRVPKRMPDGQKIMEVLPASENPPNLQPSEVVDTRIGSKGEGHCEKHSLETAVEETNQSIGSFYHEFASPKNVSIKEKVGLKQKLGSFRREFASPKTIKENVCPKEMTVNPSNMASSRFTFKRFVDKLWALPPNSLHPQKDEASHLVRLHKKGESSKEQPDIELEWRVPKRMPDGQKIQEVFSASENPSYQQPSEVVDLRPASKGEGHFDKYSLEKAVKETNQSIGSFYHEFASPKHVYSKDKVKAKAPMKLKESIPEEEDWIWNMFRKIPIPGLFETPNPVRKKTFTHKDYVSRASIEARTRSLVASIKAATSNSSKLNRTKDLSKHLKRFPSSRHEAATEFKAVPALLSLKESGNEQMQEEAVEALALLGYVPPVGGRGIRILSLDGGGTRGLVEIKCLQHLEKLSNRKIYQLFDYVSGVSTGALIAAMVCLYRLPLEECEQLYKDFSQQMFSRSRVIGTGGLVWNHAFYSSEQWEQILRAEIGHKTMIEYARDPLVPKMGIVSTLMNTPRMKNFVFRNYNLPPSTYSEYPGSCTNELWEVIRASSAATGVYEHFTIGDYVHSDGGMYCNNPTALAVHESHLLWPHETVQCVVSLGTGRYEPTFELVTSKNMSLREKFNRVVDSATDTEVVHVMMMDLMPHGTYFRFNPYLTEDLQLDEIRPELLEKMLRDTTMYLRKNELKMRKAAITLKQGRHLHQRSMDWIKLKTDSYI